MTYLLLLSMTLVVAGGVSDNLAVCYRCTTRRACHFFDSLGIAYLLDGQEPASTRVASFPALVDLEFSIGIFKSSHSLQHPVLICPTFQASVHRLLSTLRGWCGRRVFNHLITLGYTGVYSSKFAKNGTADRYPRGMFFPFSPSSTSVYYPTA